MTALLVLLAGGAGAAARWAVDGAVRARLGDRWPWGTFVVNVSGSFALGLLVGAASGDVVTVLGVGLLGAYTTFSTYAVEVVKVDAERSRAAAAAYALGSLGGGTLAAGLGLLLGGG